MRRRSASCVILQLISTAHSRYNPKDLSFPTSISGSTGDDSLSEFTLQYSHSGMIVTMQGHIGVPHFLAALGLSMLVFKPKWKACIEAGPRSMLFAALFVIGIFALVIVKGL
jgi:hypothetical protein